MDINSDLETEDVDVWEVPETDKHDIVISPEGGLVEPDYWREEREEEYESQQREKVLLVKNLPLFDK